jgi:hypothetical protein
VPALDKFDSILQTIVALVAITAVNRLLYHDGILLSVGYAFALIASFWLGRFAVRLLRRLSKTGRFADE